ncbi:hypothetical protein BDR04DRAFT_1098770 [Suillus decipiens]|nr:hypothetical protein BDR04DRAFT_1098770 [Suillus decipiens]
MATVIVLEYYAFLLPHKSVQERLRSAVAYYLQSPTAVAVEQGAKEISNQGYKKEELRKKIFEFILEHRMSCSKRVNLEVDETWTGVSFFLCFLRSFCVR